MTAKPVVIVGAGLAAWTTVRELRKLDPAVPVTLVTADSGDFYAKPTLSNALGQQRSPDQLVTTPAAAMAESLQVTLQTRTRVQAIDAVARTVGTTSGDLAFRDLVLANGALPIRVPVGGDAAGRVLSINSLDDFSVFHAALHRGSDAGLRSKRVVIMGAGLIGCEFANDLVAAGHVVTVVDPSARPLSALMPSDASTRLRDALGGMGVQWHFGQTVAEVQQAHADLRVTLSGGQTLTADLVLSAVGLRADTSLARAAGADCDRGVLVDAQLKTSLDHVYALGDVAQYQAAGNRTLPYVMPIMQAAKTLAAHLAGQAAALTFPLMPVAVKTPALPITVAPPPPGVGGNWQSDEVDVWRYVDLQGQQRGFVLVGSQTRQRMAQTKMTLM